MKTSENEPGTANPDLSRPMKISERAPSAAPPAGAVRRRKVHVTRKATATEMRKTLKIDKKTALHAHQALQKVLKEEASSRGS